MLPMSPCCRLCTAKDREALRTRSPSGPGRRSATASTVTRSTTPALAVSGFLRELADTAIDDLKH